MSNYQIEYKKLGIMLVVIAVMLVGLYILLGVESETDDITSFQLEIDQDEFSPGDNLRIIAEDLEGEPVSGVEIEVNDESIGSTNSEGVTRYRAPEDLETLQITGKYQEETVELDIRAEDDSYTVDDETEDSGEDDTDDTDDTDDADDADDETEDSGEDDADDTDDETEDSGEDDEDDTDDDEEPQQTINAETELISDKNPEEEPYELQIAINTQEELTYTIELNNNQINTGDLDNEEEIITEQLDELSDTNELEIELDNGETTETDTYTIELTEQELSDQITLQSPEEDQIHTIDQEGTQEITVEFETSLTEEDYRIFLNDDIEAEGKTQENNQDNLNLEEGEHEIYVQILEESGTINSDTVNIEIREEATVNIFEPEQTEVDNYQLEIGFDTQGTAHEFELYVNDEQIHAGEDPQTEFYTHTTEGGTQDVEVQIYTDGEEVATDQETFETEPQPEADITWISPQEEVDGPDVNTEFEIDTNVEYNYELIINDQQEHRRTEIDPSTQNHQVEVENLEQDTHNYELIVEETNNNQMETEIGQFETTEQLEFAEINNLEYNPYQNQTTGETEHHAEYEIEAHEDIDYELLLDQDTVDQGEYTYQFISADRDLGDLEEGEEYTAVLELTSQEDGATKSEQITFTAEEVNE